MSVTLSDKLKALKDKLGNDKYEELLKKEAQKRQNIIISNSTFGGFKNK